MIAKTTEQLETNEEYHSDLSHISKSMCDVFRQSRERYQKRFITKELPKPAPTDSMLLGTIVHSLVLEPDADHDYAVAPKVDRRTKSGKEEWNAFCADSEGKQVVDAGTFAAAKAIRDAVFANNMARRLLNRDGMTEVSHRWEDRESGLLLKCKPDRVTDAYMLDLKTCRDATPRGFARAAADLGYHRQHEWYTRGWATKTGETLPFMFLAVSTAEPYEVAFYELDNKAVELAANQNRSALQQLAACYRNNDWLPPQSKQIVELSLPNWSVYADEYEALA